MSSGGGGTSTQYVKSENSNLPGYVQPYFTDLLQTGQAYTLGNLKPQQYGQERVADFTPGQQQVQQNILNQQQPSQFGQASQLAGMAGLASLGAGQYNPSQFTSQQIGMPNLQQYQMGNVQNVRPMMQRAATTQAAQTSYQPNLDYFQMQGPQSFNQPGTAQNYMSPYMQNVLDVQKSQAIRDARQGQLAQDLGAARQGTYGGSRQLLASMERERNLGTQLGNIEAQGLQSAYQNAQQQFNAEQAAQQSAAQQNLQAALGVQGLGAQYGTQVALQNLSNQQQANIANQAAINQQMGMNQQQALQAALANQQMGYNVGQQNLNAALGVQQLGTQTGLAAQQANQQNWLAAQQAQEQANQFGANLGLQGLQQANQSAQTLGNLGQMQTQTDLARLSQQQATAAQDQALNQQKLDVAYQDFLRQQNYPLEMLQQYSSLLHGVPVTPSTTTTTSVPSPGIAQQILGTGLGALGMYKSLAG